MILPVLMLGPALLVPARAQTAPAAPKPQTSSVRIAAASGWRAWLAKRFPEREKNWPAPARRALPALMGKSRWDFVGTGRYGGDARPAALLIRLHALEGSGVVVVDRLVLARWQDGRWTEPVRLEGPSGIWLDGTKADAAPWDLGYLVDLAQGTPGAGPGLTLWVEYANARGEGASDSASIYASPKDGKYVFDDGP
ncbi:MAG: hypothetical protein KGL53_09415 [Elusimicrobia bacterium]|nr:hypothetical protein [Elusimicrobiota bacterium]